MKRMTVLFLFVFLAMPLVYGQGIQRTGQAPGGGYYVEDSEGNVWLCKKSHVPTGMQVLRGLGVVASEVAILRGAGVSWGKTSLWGGITGGTIVAYDTFQGNEKCELFRTADVQPSRTSMMPGDMPRLRHRGDRQSEDEEGDVEELPRETRKRAQLFVKNCVESTDPRTDGAVEIYTSRGSFILDSGDKISLPPGTEIYQARVLGKDGRGLPGMSFKPGNGIERQGNQICIGPA